MRHIKVTHQKWTQGKFSYGYSFDTLRSLKKFLKAQVKKHGPVVSLEADPKRFDSIIEEINGVIQ